MIVEMIRTETQHRWHLFEDTEAWLAHCAIVEAGIDRRRRDAGPASEID
jgi:hypothetical protein